MFRTTSRTPRLAHAEPLRVEHRTVGRRTVLYVRGEVDMATAPVLQAAIDAAVDAGTHELWVELSGTRFLESTGVHVLLDARRRMLSLNRRLAVICPGGPIRRLLELTATDRALDIFPSFAAAHHG